MKKHIAAIASTILTLALLLMGCGGNSAEMPKEVRDTVVGFAEAMEAGEIAKAGEFCTEEAREGFGLGQMVKEEMKQSFLAQMGISMEDLPEEAQKDVDGFCDNISRNIVKSYEVKNVEEAEGKYAVTANIVFGGSMDTLTEEESAEMEAKIQEITGKYQEENKDELIDIYTGQGEEEFYKKIYGDILSDILAVYNEYLDKSEGEKHTIIMTVEKIDDQGWKISDIEDVTKEDGELSVDATENETEDSAVEETTESEPEESEKPEK